MPTLPLDLPPGIVKRDSPNATAGRWRDAQWMRFRDGKAEKIGGWQSVVDGLSGLVRGMLGWTSSGGEALVAAGTHAKLYSVADALDDITPLSSTGTLTDPFTTIDTDATVTVAHTSHGRAVGSLVTFANATAVGGITIDGEYAVTTVPDANSYTIEHSSPATSSAGPGGGSVDYEYELNPGNQETSFDPVLLLLEGDQQSGTDLLLLEGDMQSNGDNILLEGDVGQFGVLSEMRFWSLDTYGAFLLALPSGGTLYEWDQPSADPRAVAVANAPAAARAMFVTPERFPILLGTTTPMTIQWPDQDDITNWTPGAASTANSRTLRNGSKLVGGTALADLISLIWSNTALYVMQYTGSEFVYDTRLVGDNCGLVAPGAFEAAFGVAYWLSDAGFMMYQGGVSPIPNEGDVRDFVLRNISQTYIGKTWCGYNPKFREVWWGYVEEGETEPNRYVMVALDTFQWATGELVRTAASHHPSPNNTPLMAGDDFEIYRHEVGLNGAGAAILSYVESGIVALSGRDRNFDIFGFIPDFERQTGTIDVTLTTFEQPMSESSFDSAALEVAEGDVDAETRLSGGYARIRVASNEIDGDVRLGVPLLEVQPAGGRR